MSADSTSSSSENENLMATATATTAPAFTLLEGDQRLMSEQQQQRGEQQQQSQRDVGKNFNIMMSKLGDEYFNFVMKLAKEDKYTLTLKKPTGRKIKDPLTDEEVDEFIGWESRIYNRHRITTEEYNKIEALRGKFNKEKDDVDAIADILAKMYRYLAYVYLQMPQEDFLRADWEEIKPVLDACNFATVYSIRNINNNGSSSSFSSSSSASSSPSSSPASAPAAPTK